MTSALMQHPTADLSHPFDVAVIGGGAAGLSAALVLGRARRSVVIIDAGAPRNAPAAGVHGFLTRDGIPPAVTTYRERRATAAAPTHQTARAS